MRITGLATGLDMDQLVTDSMKPYRIKIDKKGQEKEILEIKQKLYREVIKDSREFYNKYFDITNSNSLLLSKNWTTTKFTSSNDNVVTVTGGGDAKAENYTVTGTVAKASKVSLAFTEENGIVKIPDKMVVNGKEFTLRGDSEKEKASNLNSDLKAAGLNIKVTYTDFAGTNGVNAKGFVFESTILGEDGVFTIGKVTTSSPTSVEPSKDYKAATAATIIDFNINDFNIDIDNIIKITVNNEVKAVTIKGSDIKDEEGSIDKDKLKNALNNTLKEYNLEVTIDEIDEITFKSTKLGNIPDPKLTINEVSKTNNFINGEDEIKAFKTLSLTGNEKITINGVLVDLILREKDANTNAYKEDIKTYLNRVLKAQGLNIVAEDNGGQITLTSNNTGEDAQINISLLTTGSETKISQGGVDAEITFTNSKGVYIHKGTSNTVTLDGVTFKFIGDIQQNEQINVSGKVDVTETKDKLVKLINDYNTLIEKLNKLTTEKRNRNFNPLTSDQKKEMSEDEIKLWNERVEKGQLSRDTDLTRISNGLKSAMRTLVDGSGLNLEKIGIKPVADYQGTKNGTFTIDENTLIKALEENSEEVMNLFIKSKPTDGNLTDSQKYSKTGLIQRVKDILYNETMTSTSNFLKKVGYEGTVTAYNNTLTKSIQEYERKMSDMETDFTRREQALYSRYSTLESMMNKYNSQQSYLTQQLGMS